MLWFLVWLKGFYAKNHFLGVAGFTGRSVVRKNLTQEKFDNFSNGKKQMGFDYNAMTFGLT